MFVDILFSILNFAVLAGIFIYIFFRMFVPQLSAKIVAEKKSQEDLVSQHNLFVQRLTAVEAERERHEEMYRSMARKVAAWRNVVAEQEQIRVKEQQVRAVIVSERAERQATALVAQRRLAQIVPQAMAKARLELYDHFQNENAGHQYIDRIITGIQGRHGDR